MKIVVLDGYTLNPGDLNWNQIKTLGDIIIYDRTDSADIISRIGDAEVVLTNKTPIRKETMKACPNIKLISVLATGYDVIDIEAAKQLGIAVCNVPAYGTYSVAQFAIALLLEVCCHVGYHDNAVKKGRWENNADWCFWDKPLLELYGKTMGIIGYGRIGQTTGKIARALGMKIIANDKHENPTLKDVEYVSFDDLCSRADVIVLHCSLTKENQQFIDKKAIAKMKKNAIIINNARGQLINEKDLADALNEGRIYAAGIDVVSKEPIEKDNPLLKAKNCYITPHMSWGSVEARKRIMDMTYENIQGYLNDKTVNRIV